MKIDPARLPRSGSGGSQVSDPVEPFGYVEKLGSGKVTKVGTETVNGTRTTHYRVNVDVSTLAGGATAVSSSSCAGSWVRRRFRWTCGSTRRTAASGDRAPRPAAAAGQRPTDREDTRVTSTTTLRFDDFGTRVSVEPPPSAQTADMTAELADAAKSSQKSPQAGSAPADLPRGPRVIDDVGERRY
ncbi:hypothetical protein SALBM311S_04844 [Streptomyces alboniger]